jgi:hypothetical protein
MCVIDNQIEFLMISRWAPIQVFRVNVIDSRGNDPKNNHISDVPKELISLDGETEDLPNEATEAVNAMTIFPGCTSQMNLHPAVSLTGHVLFGNTLLSTDYPQLNGAPRVWSAVPHTVRCHVNIT